MRRVTVAAVAIALSGIGVVATGPDALTPTIPEQRQQPQPSQQLEAEAQTVRLRDAARALTVASENRTGYDRDRFNLWINADGDCLDTREEVLTDESRVPVDNCDPTMGQWYSYYDGVTWQDSSDVDIDHLVPLAEAWDSGARRWNDDTRERYANDLGDPRTLVAVTDNVNQAKGDQDIHEWLPELGLCRYVREWTVAKTRWSLTVDRAERRTLVQLADGCRNVVLHIQLAPIVRGGGGGGGGDQPLGRMRIREVVYDPPGTDTDNAETVTLVNRGTTAQLRGFSLRDSVGHSYTLPSYRIRHGRRVTIHSGDGVDGRGDLYAGWGATWNNDGDTARLLEPAGRLADQCSWGDGPGTITC